MFEIRVDRTIACAHRLFDYNGPCEELHGHNYRIEVAFRGAELDRYGMLVDFTDVKKAFNAVLGDLDHKYLNELPAFRDVSPSAENIAAYIYKQMQRYPFERGTLSSVSVWETPTQVAVYREP
ncbi:MAG: 6-carboxytetrahydropterin synthase QueD [Capsulimonadaceae bacterium]